MLRGLYTSALAMTTNMQRMDVVSNNIANIDTNGFKKDTAITQSFSEELMKRINDPQYSFYSVPEDVGGVSLGVFVQSVHTNFTEGSLKKTENSLDLAITGDGFFVVQKADENGIPTEHYTRDGAFTLAASGLLMTKDGFPVIGEGGTVIVPDGEIVIDDVGNIYANDTFVDKLKLVDFSNKDTLRKMGSNLYKRIDETTETPFNGMVEQGFVEGSNVNSVKEMVDMISLSRVYEANQKVITTTDTTLQRAVNDLGRKS